MKKKSFPIPLIFATRDVVTLNFFKSIYLLDQNVKYQGLNLQVTKLSGFENSIGDNFGSKICGFSATKFLLHFQGIS